MRTAFLLATLALSSFALYGSSLAQDNNQLPLNNQPPAQSASLEDQVTQLERQQQVMQWQLDDLRKQVAALQQAVDRLGQGNAPQANEGAPPPSPAQTTASADEGKGGGNLNSYALFYTRLQSQGKWLQDPTYGYVWQPARATEDQNWRPYTDGHWVYTDRGWTWVSNEDFGWACYHYGRWARRPDTGWVWVPGNEWGPAWVSWRESEGQGQDNGYVGWAPLPPEAEANQNVQIESWADNYYDIGPAAYVFVRVADLAQPSYRRVIVPPTENATIIANTRNITNIRYANNGFDLGGPDYARLEQEANVRIPRYNLTYSTPERGEDFRTVVRGNQLEVFAPPPRLQAQSAARPVVAQTLTRTAIDRGWRELNQTQAAELRQTFERQAPVPAGLPPSRVEQVRTAAGEGTQPGQTVGAPGQERALPAQGVGATLPGGGTPVQAVGAPAQGVTPAQAAGTPAREGATPAQAARIPAQGATRAAQAVTPPARAEATPAQAEATPAARAAVTPQGRAERPEAGASPVTRPEGRGQVAQPAETPSPNRRNLTQEPREGRTNAEVAASPTPSQPEGNAERRAVAPENRPANENVRSGEPARTPPRQAERPAETERPAGSLPAREPSADTEKRRETLSREEESASGERHRPAPKREEPADTERPRETSKREAPATGAGEAERPKHEAGEQHTERSSTPPARHPEKENGASERESQRHEAAPAKHRTDDEGKHHEGPAKQE